MTATSREIVERMFRAARAHDVEAVLALMAPDAYLEWPFRPPGVPARVTGHAELRRHLTSVAGGPIRLTDYRNEVIHEAGEVTIVEYDVSGSVVATGAPFEQSVIAVLRVRDGLIVSYRDYLNPLPLIEALAPAAS
jgi:uncharacterized protein